MLECRAAHRVSPRKKRHAVRFHAHVVLIRTAVEPLCSQNKIEHRKHTLEPLRDLCRWSRATRAPSQPSASSGVHRALFTKPADPTTLRAHREPVPPATRCPDPDARIRSSQCTVYVTDTAPRAFDVCVREAHGKKYRLTRADHARRVRSRNGHFSAIRAAQFSYDESSERSASLTDVESIAPAYSDNGVLSCRQMATLVRAQRGLRAAAGGLHGGGVSLASPACAQSAEELS